MAPLAVHMVTEEVRWKVQQEDGRGVPSRLNSQRTSGGLPHSCKAGGGRGMVSWRWITE